MLGLYCLLYRFIAQFFRRLSKPSSPQTMFAFSSFSFAFFSHLRGCKLLQMQKKEEENDSRFWKSVLFNSEMGCDVVMTNTHLLTKKGFSTPVIAGACCFFGQTCLSLWAKRDNLKKKQLPPAFRRQENKKILPLCPSWQNRGPRSPWQKRGPQPLTAKFVCFFIKFNININKPIACFFILSTIFEKHLIFWLTVCYNCTVAKCYPCCFETKNNQKSKRR